MPPTEAQNRPICARFLCTKGHFGAAATAASDPNQSFQGRVWTLDSGWKHLVGFKYAGWRLLHRPKDGSLLQLRTLFVHLKPYGHVGAAASAAYRGFCCQPKFSRSSIVTRRWFKTLGWVQICWWGVVKYAPKGQFGASAHDFCALSAGATAPPQGR